MKVRSLFTNLFATNAPSKRARDGHKAHNTGNHCAMCVVSPDVVRTLKTRGQEISPKK